MSWPLWAACCSPNEFAAKNLCRLLLKNVAIKYQTKTKDNRWDSSGSADDKGCVWVLLLDALAVVASQFGRHWHCAVCGIQRTVSVAEKKKNPE